MNDSNNTTGMGAGSMVPGAPPVKREIHRLSQICEHLVRGGHLRLFLDYDGTLVPIARTPEQARPGDALVALLTGLARIPTVDITVLSGRHLASLRAMLAVPEITLAGIYGIEIARPDQEPLVRVERETIRPLVERVKKEWMVLVAGCQGIWLEDKGFGIALHARFARPSDAAVILPFAEQIARQVIAKAPLRILGGDRFLEVVPVLANKGTTVEWLLDDAPGANALVVYFGDDDKDEEAFAVVRARGGIPIIVGERLPETRALVRLPNPATVFQWLEAIAYVANAARKPGRGVTDSQ